MVAFPSVTEQLQAISHYVIPEPYSEILGATINSDGSLSVEAFKWW